MLIGSIDKSFCALRTPDSLASGSGSLRAKNPCRFLGCVNTSVSKPPVWEWRPLIEKVIPVIPLVRLVA
jgi:hypothetical protein